jgi:site-specific recombinase XerD
MSLPAPAVLPPLGAGRSWGEVVDVYLAAGVDTANTRRVYAAALQGAFTVMRATTIDEVTPYHLASYRESVMASKLAPATKRQRIAAVRSFLRWTRAFGLHSLGSDVMDIALRLPPAKTLVPYTILTDAEITALLAAARKPRDQAFLLAMLGAGLRVPEVSALDVADLVVGEPSYIRVRLSKGDHSRAVPVRPEIMAALQRLAAGRPADAALFVTRRGPPGRLHIAGIRDQLAELGRAALIVRPVTPHMLRHSYAVRALKHTGNAMSVSKLLGHRQLSTTQRYLDHLELPDLLASVPALPSGRP